MDSSNWLLEIKLSSLVSKLNSRVKLQLHPSCVKNLSKRSFSEIPDYVLEICQHPKRPYKEFFVDKTYSWNSIRLNLKRLIYILKENTMAEINKILELLPDRLPRIAEEGPFLTTVSSKALIEVISETLSIKKDFVEG